MGASDNEEESKKETKATEKVFLTFAQMTSLWLVMSCKYSCTFSEQVFLVISRIKS